MYFRSLCLVACWVVTGVMASPQVEEELVTFSKEEVSRDLDYLYQSLVHTHYNPYAYVSKQALFDAYQHSKGQLQSSQYELKHVVTLFQRLVAQLKNGHTEIDFPVASYIQYAESGGTLFPLELVFENGKALVRTNFSRDSAVPKGANIIEINGQPINVVLNDIYPLISGERRAYQNAKLEVYTFPRYYWYAFGEKSLFDVVYVYKGQQHRATLKPIAVFDEFEARKDEILNAQRTVKFFGDVAYLNPGHFSGDQAKYREFIESAFSSISSHQANTLIVDLRNNSGGDDAFSDYLVAYFADKPFKWHSRFALRSSATLKQDTQANKDTSLPYWRSIMEHKDGERYEFEFDYNQPMPETKRFSGDIYVLINRQSHSQSSVTAAQIQDYGWGTLVGEETAEFPTLFASQFHYTLPETGLTVKIAKGYIVRVSGSERAQGVEPDIVIQDHMLDAEDEILSGLLNKLKH